MRRKALFMVLSEKARNNLLIIVDKFLLEKAKTKTMNELFKKLPLNNSSRLVLYSDGNNNVYLASRNIKKTAVQRARDLNIIDLLNNKYLLISKDVVKEIENTFTKKGE